jgi:hypothetical protein
MRRASTCWITAAALALAAGACRSEIGPVDLEGDRVTFRAALVEQSAGSLYVILANAPIPCSEPFPEPPPGEPLAAMLLGPFPAGERVVAPPVELLIYGPHLRVYVTAEDPRDHVTIKESSGRYEVDLRLGLAMRHGTRGDVALDPPVVVEGRIAAGPCDDGVDPTPDAGFDDHPDADPFYCDEHNLCTMPEYPDCDFETNMCIEDPLYCDEDTPCTNPEYPYCLLGTNMCIPDPFYCDYDTTCPLPDYPYCDLETNMCVPYPF